MWREHAIHKVSRVRTRLSTGRCRPQRRSNNLHVFLEPDRAAATFARRWIRQLHRDLEVIVTVAVACGE